MQAELILTRSRRHLDAGQSGGSVLRSRGLGSAEDRGGRVLASRALRGPGPLLPPSPTPPFGNAIPTVEATPCSCTLPNVSLPSSLRLKMSPVAIHPKPRVFSLHKLDDGSASLARHLFEYTEPGMKGWEDWKSLAEGIMVRGNALTANEIAQFGPQLRFVSKHGVGVDRFDMRALKEKGVVVMNTPGVNVGLEAYAKALN